MLYENKIGENLMHLILEFIFWIFLELICYATGFVLLYIFSLGKVSISFEKERIILPTKRNQDFHFKFDYIIAIGLAFWTIITIVVLFLR